MKSNNWEDLIEQPAIFTGPDYPPPSGTDETRAIISIAISLKRIADELTKCRKRA